MYLAEQTIQGRKNYSIRDSLYNPDTDCWQSRDLFDLGRTPWDYIVYPGGNAFYIQESICEQLAAQGIEHDICDLEELFWRFIRKEIRQKIEPFHCRGRRRSRNIKKKNLAEQQVQVFDRRRMYYLRCGVVDQRKVGSLPLRYFKGLLNKSRDEIEQYILQLEKSLQPREYKQYVYVIFDLQRYFRASPARSIPQALDQDELGRYFIKDLCRLHGDELFWAGFADRDELHDYLVRYAVMFFDYEFDGGSAWDEYLQNFINSKRFYRAPSRQTKIAITEIVEIFGVTEEDLKAMKKSELTKLFRQKAHEVHPDKGGEHDTFVRLTEAYKELMRNKS
ncbi:MAG: J domain-containing protein [Desulfobulbales bacterium]